MVKKLLSALLALFILSSFPLTVLAGDLPTSTNTIRNPLVRFRRLAGKVLLVRNLLLLTVWAFKVLFWFFPAPLFRQLASGRLRFPSRQVALHYYLIGCMPVAVLKDLTLRIYPASFRRLLRTPSLLTSTRLHTT